MNFRISVADLEELSVAEAKTVIERSYKIPLSEVKLFDLLVTEDNGFAMRHGVYVFFNDIGECLYVGMCSSSHFAHRIGGHFGMSPKYGMNTFLKRTVKMLGLKNTYASYVEALPKISEYRLLIIVANGRGKEFIGKLEKLLHIIYNPMLNFPAGFPKTYKPIDMSQRFSSSVASQ
ncbi:MAG: hypothetical protein ACK4SX_00040 [Alcanivoracaceae bacterium]